VLSTLVSYEAANTHSHQASAADGIRGNAITLATDKHVIRISAQT